MNREKEREYQENLAYLKEKLPHGDAELPLKLQAETLKQRALAGEKPQRSYGRTRWSQAAAMACAFVLIAGIGLYGSKSSPSVADTAGSSAAPAAMETAPETEMAAFSVESKMAKPSALGGRYDVAVIHKKWDDYKNNYNISPEHIHTLDENAESFTVITCYPDEGGMAQIVIIGGQLEKAFEGDTVTFTELSSGKYLKFKALTLELIG